ncbi:MAG: hypothetical protein MJ180_05890, partial [Candidatus Gastranaerophilales bacterium]|nr:hypothetical protein [Candidatus Gastranaerophilales bacterium]
VFLQLMVTQLQNQDPLNPMDNTEFLSQQAQFSQVTAMQDIKETLNSLVSLNGSMMGANSFSQALNVVGKEVTVADPDNPNETITGVVESVKITDEGSVLLSVNGREIPSENLRSVSNQTGTTDTTSTSTTTDADTTLKNTAKDFLSDILNNPKLKDAAANLIEKLAGNFI